MSARDDLVAAIRRRFGPCVGHIDDNGDVQLTVSPEAAQALLALLTEPTLEEVLAELGLHGEIHLQFSLAWACELIPADERESIVYVRAHDTPLEAARECLRRVKE